MNWMMFNNNSGIIIITVSRDTMNNKNQSIFKFVIQFQTGITVSRYAPGYSFGHTKSLKYKINITEYTTNTHTHYKDKCMGISTISIYMLNIILCHTKQQGTHRTYGTHQFSSSKPNRPIHVFPFCLFPQCDHLVMQ